MDIWYFLINIIKQQEFFSPLTYFEVLFLLPRILSPEQTNVKAETLFSLQVKGYQYRQQETNRPQRRAGLEELQAQGRALTFAALSEHFSLSASVCEELGLKAAACECTAASLMMLRTIVVSPSLRAGKYPECSFLLPRDGCHFT